MSTYRVAIIGAGPTGCTLARLLSESGHDVTIFEAESGIDVRSQGGSLDLRHDGGLAALKAAGLYDEFLRYARFDGEALVIADKNLKAWLKVSASSGNRDTATSRPEIDRRQLRQMLFDSLKPGTIRWNSKVKQVASNADGDISLEFSDGSKINGFDLVVGADGAWSKARTTLTDTKPYYSGISVARWMIPNAEQKHPDLYELANRGSVFTFSDGKGMTLQYLSDGSLMSSAHLQGSEAELSKAGLRSDDPVALRSLLLKEFGDWAPLLRKAIEISGTENLVLPLYMLPVGARWEHSRGVTLIGDAAHVMTPYAGIGVNVGMQDAVCLARAIDNAARDGGGRAKLDQHVAAFEQDMFPRMAAAMQLSWGNCKDMLFTPGAPRSRIQEYVGRNAAAQVPAALAPVVRAVARLAYFIIKIFR